MKWNWLGVGYILIDLAQRSIIFIVWMSESNFLNYCTAEPQTPNAQPSQEAISSSPLSDLAAGSQDVPGRASLAP